MRHLNEKKEIQKNLLSLVIYVKKRLKYISSLYKSATSCFFVSFSYISNKSWRFWLINYRFEFSFHLYY
jgi:hypothetical protein